MNHLNLNQFINIFGWYWWFFLLSLTLTLTVAVLHIGQKAFFIVCSFLSLTRLTHYIRAFSCCEQFIQFHFYLPLSLFLFKWIRIVFRFFLSFAYFSSLSLSLLVLHLFQSERIQVTCILTTTIHIFFHQYPVASFVWCHFYCVQLSFIDFIFCFALLCPFCSLCCFYIFLCTKAEPFYCMDFQQISCFTDLFACGNWKREKSVLRLFLLQIPNAVAAVVISQLECTTSGHDITSKIDSSARICSMFI